MRAIKFRAWYHHKDNHDNGWMEYLDIGINQLYQNKFIIAKSVPAYTNGFYVPLDNFEHEKDFAFMQFTGLCDKTGKEIYEGDIIVKPANKNRHLEVVFADDIACFEAIHSVGARGLSGYVNTEGGVLIIGNIYENPELLEDKT